VIADASRKRLDARLFSDVSQNCCRGVSPRPEAKRHSGQGFDSPQLHQKAQLDEHCGVGSQPPVLFETGAPYALLCSLMGLHWFRRGGE